ncbi:hypothetical protein KDU71_07170 [Carboxylicivirga sediminis]|uniref:DUF4843 domain-containing protein n=1 Tax=Carboxylicivirga sediminis TaxID=2006564 RepID=A0A941IWM1_9BACT|nr:hypothetical protein [Carboxylicivirga sediminis]MBR8535335.1 hypothetical protein [Carboxylicivirga sediminis]
MKNILLILMIAVVALTACDQDNVMTKLDTGGVDYVAVAHTAIDAPYMLNADNNYSISFPIHRTYKNVSGTVANLEMASNDDTGLFVLESTTLSFADGEAVAYAVVSATNPSAIDPAKIYTFELSVTGDNASPLYHTAEFNGQLELKFTSMGTASFESTFFGEAWTVEIFKAEGLSIYKAEALYEDGYDILIIEDEGAGTVSVPEQKAWFQTDVELPARIAGSGTVSTNGDGKKVFAMEIEHYLPEYDHTWGVYDEVLTMP